MKYVAILLLFSVALQARTLTWIDTLQLAKQNSLEYQAALATYKSTEATEMTGISGFLPRLSVTAGANHSGAESGDSTHSYSAQLSLTENLFAGFSDVNNFHLKKSGMRQALGILSTAEAKLSADLKQAFGEVYYSQDSMRLAADILNRRKENYKTVQLQYGVGHENKGSVLLSEAYVHQAEYDLQSIAASQETLFEDFRRSLGLPADEPIKIEQNIPREEPMKENPDFKKMAETNYVVLAAQADEQSALYALKISKAKFLPSLDFTGSYGYGGSTWFPETNRWSLGLLLTVPLFDSWRDYSAYKSSDYKLESSHFSASNTAVKVATDLKRAYNDYVLAVQKEKLDESFSKAAVLRADIARSKYKNGFLSFEDWDIVETDLILKEKTILDSERTRIIKQAVWEKAQGIGVFK